MNKLLVILTVGLFLFCSCEQEDDILYQEEARVNFGSVKYQDAYSLDLSFGERPFCDQEISYSIPVYLMGDLADKDRTFKLCIDTASNAPDTTFKALADSYTIKANSAEDSVVITFNRLKIQGDNTYMLVLKFDESSELKPGVIEANTFTITYNNYLAKPSWWDLLSEELGPYQQEKYQKYIEINEEYIQYWQVQWMKYDILKKWKPVKEFFENHPEYGVVFPDTPWPV